MKVRATKHGFWPHTKERMPGDEFDYDGPLKVKRGGKEVDYFPSWMRPLEKMPEPKGDDDDAELEALRQEYETVFGKKPHHKAGADKLRQELDDHKAKMAD